MCGCPLPAITRLVPLLPEGLALVRGDADFPNASATWTSSALWRKAKLVQNNCASGMLPAACLAMPSDHESDDILWLLSDVRGLGDRMKSPAVAVFARLERDPVRGLGSMLVVSRHLANNGTKAVAGAGSSIGSRGRVDECCKPHQGPCFFPGAIWHADLSLHGPYIEADETRALTTYQGLFPFRQKKPGP